MSTGIMYYLDVALLVVIMVIGVNNVCMLMDEWNDAICVAAEDKSAKDSQGSIYVETEYKTGADLLMALAVTDSMIPYPRSIRINDTPIIDLDNSWLSNKNARIMSIYSTTGSYKLGAMLDWEITSVEYVPNNGDPYWQYILEEVQ